MKRSKYIIVSVALLLVQFVFGQNIYYKDLIGRWYLSGRNNDLKTPVSLQEFSDSSSKKYADIFRFHQSQFHNYGTYELKKNEDDFVLSVVVKMGASSCSYMKMIYFLEKIDASTLILYTADTNERGDIIRSPEQYNESNRIYLKRENPFVDSLFGVQPYYSHYGAEELVGYWYYLKNGIGNVVRFVDNKTLISVNENGKFYNYFVIMAGDKQQFVVQPLGMDKPKYIYSIDRIFSNEFKLKYVFRARKNDSLSKK